MLKFSGLSCIAEVNVESCYESGARLPDKPARVSLLVSQVARKSHSQLEAEAMRCDPHALKHYAHARSSILSRSAVGYRPAQIPLFPTVGSVAGVFSGTRMVSMNNYTLQYMAVTGGRHLHSEICQLSGFCKS